MKNTKFFALLISFPALGMIATPLTSCGRDDKTSTGINKIEVTTNPTKLSYKVGDKLDLTGMVITATDFDGETNIVTSECTTDPDVNTPLTLSHNKVVVTHTVSGNTAEFNIAVNDQTEITKIEVTKEPNKISYAQGEKLDLTGLVVTATYSDSTTKDVTSECTTLPSKTVPLTNGETEVTITHTPSSKTCKFGIYVGEPKILSLTVNPPAKTEYRIGEKLDLTGMVVIATGSDGELNVVTSECTTEPDVNTPLTLSHNKVIVTHAISGKTTEFNIQVINEKLITKIEVTKEPNKISYAQGEKLDLTGLVVTATYFDSSTKDVTSECTTLPSEDVPLTDGETEVTVTHTPSSKTCKFGIYVGEPKIVGLTITPPAKTEYRIGEQLDLKGMVVDAIGSDGKSSVVTSECTTEPDVNTLLTLSHKKVIVTHTTTGKTTEFDIQVINEKLITKIEVTTEPTKLSYGQGEKLDLTGMVVTATYFDSTTKDVTSECTTLPSEDVPLTDGETEVTVTHTPSSKTCKFGIYVGEPKIVGLTITPPAKTEYRIGEKLDLKGMVVDAIGSDGKSSVVTSECTTEPDINTPLVLSHKKVIVTHTTTGKTIEFDIQVINEKLITKIEVTTEPTKLSYAQGEKLDLTGMVVTVTYFDSTTKDVTSECTTLPSEDVPLTDGETEVTVTHTPSSKTCKFGIYVGQPKIVSLTITPPARTKYKVGEKLDLTGMAVKANWSDETLPTVVTSECSTDPDTNTSLKVDNTKVAVIHTPSSVTSYFKIDVIGFQNDTWSNLINNTKLGLEKMKQIYCVSSFIGLERAVIINNKKHIVRVIGEECDVVAGTNNKAMLTFELVTLLSDSKGNKMTSKLDKTNNYDYTNSVLRANLNGTGTGEKSFSSTVLEMLPSELQSSIKLINKKVATYNPDVKTFEVKPEGYNDKLFPLTYTEMAQEGSGYASLEGTAYSYWIDHNTATDRIKKDANNNPVYYWLCSPYTHYNNYAWIVDGGGCIYNNCGVNDKYGVSFGFCI